MPPNAFWSVSMYQIEADGRLFFFPNPLSRFAIGNRTAGLRRTVQGHTDIVMAATDPGDAQGNWLPAPDGAFALVFRAYIPSRQLLDGSWRLPPVRRA
jgi:hypothetical protein